MLRKRDPIAIGNVGTYTINQAANLRTAQQNLVNKTNDFLNNYQGSDGELIAKGFLDYAAQIDTIIKNLEDYGKYMQNVADIDRQNLLATKNSFRAMGTIDTSSTNSYNQSLSLDAINDWGGK